MKREYWKDCVGCCWIKKAGQIVWACEVRECPFHRYFFGHSDQTENGNEVTAQTCST